MISMNITDRKVWLFALSWATRWYQASMGWDATWLVLLVWVGLHSAKHWRTSRQSRADGC